jgi:hypothetical protein
MATRHGKTHKKTRSLEGAIAKAVLDELIVPTIDEETDAAFYDSYCLNDITDLSTYTVVDKAAFKQYKKAWKAIIKAAIAKYNGAA